MLRIKSLTKNFGGLVAVDHVDLHVERGEIVGLIGPNGSGKTTLFNCIMGIYGDFEGSVLFCGRELNGARVHEIVWKGIARTFQTTNVFPELTTVENMLLGQVHVRESVLSSLVKKSSTQTKQTATELLEFVGLSSLSTELAGNLSYGQQKLLEIAISLMSGPTLLLMDEPTAGVNPAMIEKIEEKISMLNSKGLTVLLIEHNMNFVMSLCQRICVLNYGKMIAEGSPEQIQNDDEVFKAYFGG